MSKDNVGVIQDNDIFTMTVKNDGKGNSQSYECYVELKGDCNIYAYGYGEDSLEAREECLEKITKYFNKINYTKDSIQLDVKLEKAGVKSYLNKVDVLWEDSMERYHMVKTMLEKKGFVCTTEFSPMIGPSSRFEKDCIVLIMAFILPKDTLTIFNSGIPVVHSNKFDYTNIMNLEQLVDMMVPGFLM